MMDSEYKLISGLTAADAKSLARNNVTAFWTQSWWRVLWGSSSLEDVASKVEARSPKNIHTNTNVRRHEKVVDSAGNIVGYARWVLSEPLADHWLSARTMAVSEQEEAAFDQQYASVDWHLTDTSALDPPVDAATEKYRPREPHIKLDYLAVHPGHHRRGIANKLVLSGLEQAQRLQVDVFVLATSKDSLQLYRRLGFEYLDGFSQSQEPWGLADTFDTYFLIKHPSV